MSYSLNSLKGGLYRGLYKVLVVIKGDTRSLDNDSHAFNKHFIRLYGSGLRVLSLGFEIYFKVRVYKVKTTHVVTFKDNLSSLWTLSTS